jgi:epoxyqueuosine reductase
MTVLAAQVKERAQALGFMACGITDLSPTPHGEELDEWLSRGYAGTMRYLNRQASRRKEPQRIAIDARTAIVVLDNYFAAGTPTKPPKIARYARGQDYHLDLGRRLDQLATWLTQQGAALARSYVDVGPVPERELARRAGLGWIGKNTMLIRPGAGSFFFIGTVLTDLQLAVDLPFDADRCGNCTRCLDACPTAAFPAPHVLDATRCISYHTIEFRGPFEEEVAAQLDGWAFGCDVCNEVCPWNIRFAEPSSNLAYRARKELEAADLEFFDRMSEEEFTRRFGDTPLERPGLAGMRRNWHAALEGPAPASADSLVDR